MKPSQIAVRRESFFVLACIFLVGFLITGFSCSMVSIGLAPIYYIDLTVLAIFVYSFGSKGGQLFKHPNSKITNLIGIIWVATIISEMFGVVHHGGLLESLFMAGRYTIATVMVFCVASNINSHNSLEMFLLGIAVGSCVTATMTFGTSFPQTRPLALRVIENPLVGPRISTVRKKSEFRGDTRGIRGRSLIGNSNLSGGFLSFIWPIVMMSTTLVRSKFARVATILASILVPIGALASYSRGTYLGLALVFCVVSIYGKSTTRIFSIVAILVILAIVAYNGVDSEALYIDRIRKSTERTISDPTSADSAERFLSYADTVRHLSDNPHWLFYGSGSAARKMQIRNAFLNEGEVEMEFDRSEYANHSAFAMSYFYFGVPGALGHLGLMFFSIMTIYGKGKKCKNPQLVLVWRSLLASWFAVLPWWLFSPAPAATARGYMVFMIFFALILVFQRMTESLEK